MTHRLSYCSMYIHDHYLLLCKVWGTHTKGNKSDIDIVRSRKSVDRMGAVFMMVMVFFLQDAGEQLNMTLVEQ